MVKKISVALSSFLPGPKSSDNYIPGEQVAMVSNQGSDDLGGTLTHVSSHRGDCRPRGGPALVRSGVVVVVDILHGCGHEIKGRELRRATFERPLAAASCC